MNGDMVHVISAAIQDAPSAPAPMEEEKEKMTQAQSVNGNKVVPVKEPAKPKIAEIAPKDVVEDAVDQELAKTDGWTPQKKGPQCVVRNDFFVSFSNSLLVAITVIKGRVSTACRLP